MAPKWQSQQKDNAIQCASARVSHRGDRPTGTHLSIDTVIVDVKGTPMAIVVRTPDIRGRKQNGRNFSSLRLEKLAVFVLWRRAAAACPLRSVVWPAPVTLLPSWRPVSSRLVSSRLVVSVRKMSGDAASAQPTGSAKTPNDFLKSIKGRPVVVKLNSGVDYRGMPGLLILVSVFSPSFLHDCRCWFLASGFARSSPINFFFFCCWI